MLWAVVHVVSPKMKTLLFLSLIFLVYPCLGIILHLNESEYERMPALFALDEYEECLARERGQYCLLKLQLFHDGSSTLMDMIREYSDNKINHFNHSEIERGICVRETCANFVDGNLETEEGLKQSLAACLNESIWREYGLQANVSALYYCDQHGKSEEINTLDWAVLAVFMLIVMVNVIASCYDYIINKYNKDSSVTGNKYILSFSLIRNFKFLTSFEPENTTLRDFKFIHFVRTLFSFCMIIPHVALIITAYIRNPQQLEKMTNYAAFQIVSNGTMTMQILFFISGLLLAYNFQIHSQKNQVTWRLFPKIMLMRWLRLSPVLAVVLAFSATWMRHLGSGPLWNLHVTTSVVADCRSYWWYHLLYVSNYVTDNKCIIPSWHIAADTQVYIVSVLVCVATVRRGRYLALAALLVVGTVIPPLQVWWQNLGGVVVLTPEYYRNLNDPTFRYAYMAGHTNLQAFVVGLMVAHLIYDWQERGVDLSKNKYFTWIFWLTPPVVILWLFSGNMFYVDGQHPLSLRMLYAASHRLVLAIIITPFVIGMVLRAPSTFRTMAFSQKWVIPSRLSYCVYLINMNVVHMLMGYSRQLRTVDFLELIILQLGVVFLSYILAVPCYLMVEAPCHNLTKVLLDSRAPLDVPKRKSD